MPEEPTTEIPEVETPVETPPAETPPTHPLEPGGPRFEEVIREKNFWKNQYEALAVKNTASPQSTAPPKRVYTSQEIDQAVTAGQISIAQAADLIASQRVDASR